MKVCLVSPSIFYLHGKTQPRALYHLPYLYSYLRQHLPGVEVSVVDFELEMGHIYRQEEIDEYLRIAEVRLRQTGFDIVGISCWTSRHYLSTMAVAGLCRRLNPAGTIVVGGYHPSLVPQDFEFAGTPIDYIVQGEGEEAFRRIVAGEVPQETRPQRVPGTPIELASLTLLWDEYPYYRNTGVIGLWLSRGCPFACGYCLDRLSRYRGYTAHQAVSEVQRIVRLFPNLWQIMFCDALFGLSKEWRREFLPLLVEMKPDIEIWSETRVDLIQPEDLDLIARLRFQLDMGLEHISPRMLAIMKKTNNPQHYLERWETVDAYMNELQIPHEVYQILNYPGETSETQQVMYDYWMRFYDKNPENWTHASPSIYSFYPGGELFSNWKHYEETYGTRVLFPEWWKIPDLRRQDLTGAVIPSRELMEANLVHRGRQYADAIWRRSLQTKHPRLEERRPGGFGMPVSQRAVAPEDDGFLDDKTLRLQDLTHRHDQGDGTLVLYNFESGSYFRTNHGTSEVLRSVLERGATLNDLAEQSTGVDPRPGTRRQQLRKLFWDLVSKRFLDLGLAPREPLPPPPARPRVVLNTTAGRIILELYGREMPGTVANFLHLVRRGFYNELFVYKTLPETFIQVGAWLYMSDAEGPGYTLEIEPSPFGHERGSVSLLRLGPRSHASQFFIWRSAQPQFDGRDMVFGHVAEGMACVDQILTNNDRILSAFVEGEVPPVVDGDLVTTPLPLSPFSDDPLGRTL